VPDLATGTGSFVVTTANDRGPGSIEQAIEEVNHSSRPAVISFDITPTMANSIDGIITIRPGRALSIISRGNVTIDGSTEPGASVSLNAKHSRRLGIELLTGASELNLIDFGVSI
jgi:hypothetical protein